MNASDGTALDISQGAVDSGWKSTAGVGDGRVLLVHRLDDEPIRSKLGSWPGGIPSPPIGALTPTEPP